MVTTQSGQAGHAPAKEPAKKQKLQANDEGNSEKTTKSHQENPKNQNHQKAAKSTTWGEDVLGELGRQDVDRMRHLAGDESDAIYADLQNRKMEHPGIQKDM